MVVRCLLLLSTVFFFFFEAGSLTKPPARSSTRSHMAFIQLLESQTQVPCACMPGALLTEPSPGL